ncbi:MAG: hypothetical protein N2067_00375 [Spirochaetaceae bacterium]|nr:hypothetical protein [Spirochaetaceae bacterium]
MKKSGCIMAVMMLALAGPLMVRAQTLAFQQDSLLAMNAKVSSKIAILSAPGLDLGSIDPVKGNVGSATIVIMSNSASWVFAVWAEKGALTMVVNNLFVTDPGATVIPYTFTFNEAGTNTPTARILNATLPTGSEKAISVKFTSRTTGGSAGQGFVYKITVPPCPPGIEWEAGFYRDIIYVSVAAL